MDYATQLMSQVTDIFRIGLLMGLLYTTERTRAQTGVLVPLLAGIVFVAVIIPMTAPVAGTPALQAITSGIVANTLIVAVLWPIWTMIKQRL
jgi:hypothetical protein